MANRREFLQGAAAASALPLLPAGAIAAASSISAMPLYKALADKRFPEAQSFAVAARQSGLRAQSFKADITSLWFDDLHHRWRKSPVAVAGLTAPSALFCLERLAWDHQMRLAFLAEHARASDGTLTHKLHVGEGLQEAELKTAGASWSSRIAQHFAQLANSPTRGESSAHLPIFALDDQRTLVSWIIAPSKRAIV